MLSASKTEKASPRIVQRRSNGALALGLILVLLSLSSSSPSRSQSGPASGQEHGDVVGPWVNLSNPPASSKSLQACSLYHPLCVHGAPGDREPNAREHLLAVLDAADRAYATMAGALALPPPLGELDGLWHVYLVDRIDGGGTAAALMGDPTAHFARASSFGLVDREIPPGCGMQLALARAVARGSLWRLAPATDAGSALAQTEALARLAATCSAGGNDDALFQLLPELPLVEPSNPSFARGASLFFDWLDSTFGRQPGDLLRGLLALTPTKAPASGAPDRWAAKPTVFDVLAVSFAEDQQTPSAPLFGPASPSHATTSLSMLDPLFTRFALARGVALSPTPRLAWHISWPDNPRRFASPVPTAPTGASYVLVDVVPADSTRPPPHARLRAEVEWEEYGRMRWVALKLDARGKVLAELPLGSLQGGTLGALTIEELDHTDRVLLVGVNVGNGDGNRYAFEPNQGEWEPHGWLLTLRAE